MHSIVCMYVCMYILYNYVRCVLLYGRITTISEYPLFYLRSLALAPFPVIVDKNSNNS